MRQSEIVEDRRLRVLRKLQFLFGTFKTQASRAEIPARVGFIENFTGGWILLVDFPAHSGVLGSLARENKCNFHVNYLGIGTLPAAPGQSEFCEFLFR